VLGLAVSQRPKGRGVFAGQALPERLHEVLEVGIRFLGRRLGPSPEDRAPGHELIVSDGLLKLDFGQKGHGRERLFEAGKAPLLLLCPVSNQPASATADAAPPNVGCHAPVCQQATVELCCLRNL
ncbi:MAG: hypothetical protein ACREA9_19785, partial [Pyrinomonadaceae bacterium]